jgi:MFS family permease
MMAASASLPFFVFTLPAGAISDVVNRQNLFIGTYLWLAGAAGLLAVCTWLNLVHPYLILVTVFLLGIGFAFNAPVWASIVPDIVRKEELAFGLFIAVVPALLPVVAFQHLHLAAIQLGLVFTSLGIGSLLGAIGAALCSDESHAEHVDDSRQSHPGIRFYFHGHRSKSLDLSPSRRLGRD